MTERKTAETINAEAIEWVTRLDRDVLTGDTLADFEAWQSSDRRCVGAYVRAQASWQYLDRARALSSGNSEGIALVEAGELQAESSALHVPIARRSMILGGATAGVGALAATFGLGLMLPPQQALTTARGEIRRVPLSDGSLASINTESTIDVLMTRKMRNVRLNSGEVWVEVAKDRSRPFIVEAGNVRVRAVGTAFSVRKRNRGVDVLVTEGVVQTWALGEDNNRLEVSAGERVFVSDISGPANPIAASAEIERTLAWRNGQIVLEGSTVAEAVDEFNRYNVRTIILVDPNLGSERLIGRFRTNEPEAFARSLSHTLGARIELRDSEILISSG